MSYSEHWLRTYRERHSEFDGQSQVYRQEPVEPTPPVLATPLPWLAAIPQATATFSLPGVFTHATGPSEVLTGSVSNKLHGAGEEKLSPSEIVTQACYLRRRQQLTQQAFAAQLGISSRTLQDWEQGRRQPSGPGRALLLQWIDQHAQLSESPLVS